MKKYDRMLVGLAGGLLTPVLVFAAYFTIHDPKLNLIDVLLRLNESGVLSHYLSLCAIANLLLFFLFLRIDAERAARGVLGATLIYAFTVLFLKMS
jgi:hypothetical protein